MNDAAHPQMTIQMLILQANIFIPSEPVIQNMG